MCQPLRMQKQTRYTEAQVFGLTNFEAQYGRAERIPAKHSYYNQGKPL